MAESMILLQCTFVAELSCRGIFDLFNSTVVSESSSVCCFESRNAALTRVLLEEGV